MEATKIAIALAAAAAAIVALAEARKIASVRTSADGRIDAVSVGGDSLTNGLSAVSVAISASTNALAEVAHTGDMMSLTNAPAYTIRATIDGDGITRFRIFSTTPTTQAPKGNDE